MKKAFGTLIASAYILVSNYCVTFAVVTGEAHAPKPAATSSEPSHPGCPGHPPATKSDEQPSGDSKSEACCVSILCDSPALPAVQQAFAAPTFVFESLPVSVLEADAVLDPLISRLRDHGPPKIASTDPFSPSLPTRAPPSL